VKITVIFVLLSLSSLFTENAYTQRAKGKEAFALRRIGAEAHVSASPSAVSADGKRIAYTTPNDDLAIRDLSTGKEHILAKNDVSWRSPRDPVFSPDGKTLAYSVFTPLGGFDIMVVNPDGTNRHLLFHRNKRVQGAYPYTWSHNGRYIAALFSVIDGTNQIALVNTANGSALVLKTLQSQSPTGMDFSPDDRYLAYDYPQGDKGDERDISLLAIDGTRVDSLVKNPADDFLLGWSPNGKYIVFASDRRKNIGVWVQGVKDGRGQGNPRLIRSNVGYISPLGITRSGSLYYDRLRGMTNVYVATLNPSTGKIVVPPAPVTRRPAGGNSAPDWSPDGRQIAYLRQLYDMPNRTGPSVAQRFIVIRTLATGEERTLSSHIGAISSYSDLRWSPDGRSVVLEAADKNNRSALFVIDAGTGSVVSSYPSIAAWAEWSPDGKEIYYAEYDTTQPISRPIQVRELGTGGEEVLYNPSGGNVGFSIAVSRDGRQIAFSEFEPDSKNANHGRYLLKAIPSSGGVARTLYAVKSSEGIGGIAWGIDGSCLYFERAQYLWRIPANGAEPRRIMKLGPSHGVTQISIHPDGRRIAYSAGKQSTELWMMENFLQRSK
jgi:Tol biopolymer transport system component